MLNTSTASTATNYTTIYTLATGTDKYFPIAQYFLFFSESIPKLKAIAILLEIEVPLLGAYNAAITGEL